MILVTGASGQLGRLVIDALLAKGVTADTIIAAVRSPEKVEDLAAKGIVVRKADYNNSEELDAAFAGISRALLISSSEIGQRTPQHSNVIDAAKSAGVKLLAYTSLLSADTSPMSLAAEHKATESILADSDVPYVVLRNGWYSENHTASAGLAVEHGVVLGCAGEGRFSSATRADYAEAAASVLTSDGHAGKVYELAGDESFSLSDYANYLTSISGKQIAFQNMPEADFKNVLLEMQLPEPLAELLASSDTSASQGALQDDSKTLSSLIGRATTPMQKSIEAALKA